MPNFVQIEEFAARTARDLKRSSSTFEELATSLSQRVTARDRTAPRPTTKSGLLELVQGPDSGREKLAMAFPRQTMITGIDGTRTFQPTAAYYCKDANLYSLGSDRFLYVTPTTSTEHLRVEDWTGGTKNITYAKMLRDDFSVELPTLKMASGEMPKSPQLALEIGNDKGITPLFIGQVHNRIVTTEGSKFNTLNNFVASESDRELASMPVGITFAKADVDKVLDKNVNTPMGKGWILGIDDKSGEALVRTLPWPVIRTQTDVVPNLRESYPVWMGPNLAFRDLEGRIYEGGPNGKRLDGVGVFKPGEVTVETKEGFRRLDAMLGVDRNDSIGERAAGGYLSGLGSLVKLNSLFL